MNLDFLMLDNEEELKRAIDERLDELYSNSQERRLVGYENTLPLKGFIPRETIIDNGGSYYYIKNNDYIYEFINELRENNITDENKILKSIYYFLNKYFGIDGDEERRLDIFNQNTNGNDYPDISVLKGKNAAMCSERAAIAQNLFSFLGIESYYISGKIDTRKEQGEHAFNIIKYNGKTVIYDATRDVPLYKGDKIVAYRYYLQEIESNQISDEGVSRDAQFQVDDYCYRMQENGKWSKDLTGKRIYASGMGEIDIGDR